ncbi:MAG: flippase [Planctomycetota bacterium]|nr:flippase [Planctomycetota bacterium]
MKISSIQRQSVITLFSTIALTGIGFLSTIYFAHVLGPEPLGAYFLLLAYYGIFNLIGDGGFGGAAVKRISEGEEPNEYFSAFVFIRIVLLAVSVTTLLFAEPYLKDINSSGIFFWILIALIVSVFASSTGTGVYGAGKVGIFQISNFVEVLLRFIFQISAVFIGFGVAGLAGGFIGGLIAGGIANFHYLELKLVRFRTSHLKNLSGFSFWIFLTASGSLIFSYADTLLIGFFMSNADVGIYRTAFQLTSVATFTTLALHSVLYPKISNWGAHGQVTEIKNSLARAFTYSLLLAIPTCVGGWILGERLLYYLYGASFVEGNSALFFLLLVQIVNVFMYLGTMTLAALNRPKDAFWITVIASIANILLNLVLIPIMGITGAAIATLIAMTLNALGALILLSRVIPVRIEYDPVKNILCATGLMGVFLLFIHFFLPLTHVVAVLAAVIVGAVIYIFALFRLDQKIHDDIKDLSINLGVPWPRWL